MLFRHPTALFAPTTALCLLLPTPPLHAADVCTIDPSTKHLSREAQRSVVVTKADYPAVFANDRFALSKTLAKILSTGARIDKTSGVPEDKQRQLASSDTEQVALLATLIRSFRKLDRKNDGVTNNATYRPNEAEIEARQMLAEMKPVGLFNRLDLAPKSFRYCGEHRVVYAMGDPTPTIPGTNIDGERLLLIFEAAVDNPDPRNSRAGCLRIAKFWDRLRAPATEATLPTALEAFYYDGVLGDADSSGNPLPPIAPVLSNQHFGVPFGQVRGNLFRTGAKSQDEITIKPKNPWMLREWRTFVSGDATPVFVPDTVKSNPNPEFYGDAEIPVDANDDGSNHGRTQDFVDLRPEFKDKFLLSHVRELIESDLKTALESNGQTKPSGDQVFNRLGALFDDRYNDFESVSSKDTAAGENDDPEATASAAYKDAINAELRKFVLPTNWSLDASHILNRAGALSCAGCHRLTVGKPIGPGGTDDMKWPASIGFVHIDEDGKLSPALLEHFLPDRCNGLQRFIGETPPAVARELVGGTSPRTRRSLERFRQLRSPVERSAALPSLETEIVKARSDDAASEGAFRRFRRTH